MERLLNLKSWIVSHKITVFAGVLVLFTGIVIVLATAAVRAPGSEQEGQKQGKVTLTGMLICLPHKHTDGPQTLECTSGFKSDAGDYYALKDENPDHSKLRSAPFNTPVEISGTFQPGKSDMYQMVGTVTVSSIKEW